MARYKVIQDVEADDKLIGWLSLKQFMFAIVFVVLAFIDFRILMTTSLGVFRWVVIFVTLPFLAIFGVLAAPLGKDQPTEVWLLARLRFALKPRKRLWNQTGMSQLVTITAPKRMVKVLTKDITQNEVETRLNALSSLLDSRGWAIKNSNVNLSTQPAPVIMQNDDRLTGASFLPQEVSNVDVTAADDILDASSNTVAQHFEQMIQQSEQEHREELQQKIAEARMHVGQKHMSEAAAADAWFSNQPSPAPATAPAQPPVQYVLGGSGQTVAPHMQSATPLQAPIATPMPDVSPDVEQAILEKAHKKQQANSFGHLKTIQPLGAPTPTPQLVHAAPPLTPATVQSMVPPPSVPDPPTAPVPQAPANPADNTASNPAPNPVIMNLASRNDLNIDVVAREAKRDQQKNLPNDEVVISLR